MKKILISTFDMEVGGVERSLISMLKNFDYYNYNVDLMLYRHTGDFLELLPDKHNLLKEIYEYSSFRRPISELIKEKNIALPILRILAKAFADFYGKMKRVDENGYYQMQLMWRLSLPFLPRLDLEYDAAISYLWPHYFVSEKVNSKKKIAWVHTDFSAVNTFIKMDFSMWNSFNNIIAVSEQCKEAFIKKYPQLEKKTAVIENITSPDYIRRWSEGNADEMERSVDSFNLLTVARLSYAKGIDNAVMALKLLQDRGIGNINWFVVGYGGDEYEIRELINKYNLTSNFILLGKKTNPYPYIRACDLYVQPSRYEGKAVTVTEAQILGKPVLITNYKTSKSQVKHKFDGYITEISAEGIANGIETLYRNNGLRHELSDNCRNINYYNNFELEKLYSLIE